MDVKTDCSHCGGDGVVEDDHEWYGPGLPPMRKCWACGGHGTGPMECEQCIWDDEAEV